MAEFFFFTPRAEMGFESHELRSLTSGLLRCNHPRPDLCLLGVALLKINEANCRDPFRLYGGGILPARSNQEMLCANKSIIVKRKSERQITHRCIRTLLSSSSNQIPLPQPYCASLMDAHQKNPDATRHLGFLYPFS